MNKKVIPLVVQLKQNNNYIVQGINQNDAGLIFDLKIMDGLVPFDFSGYSIITLKIKKPDDTFTYAATNGTYIDIVNATKGRLKINIPTSCTAQNGMHFCSVAFAQDEETVFASMSFNYFVGEDPNVNNDDVIGTNEFPILNNLIAQIAGIISAENSRVEAEDDRETAEDERQAAFDELMAAFNNALQDALWTLDSANYMLTQVYQALASGSSIAIGDLTEFATKTYVQNYVKRLDFGLNGQTGQKDRSLRIMRGSKSAITNTFGQYLGQGEPAYATDTHELMIFDGVNQYTVINAPCYVADTTAPTDTSKLWIDTSGSAPVIKYYNGTTWTNCNTAVYG